MTRPVSATLALLLSLVLFWAANARAEDEILKLIPEQALGFAIVNRLADADAKLQQLGRQLNLPIPSLLAKLQGPGGIREGLDKHRPVAVLAMGPGENKIIPIVIVLVPVSDYAKFLEQFKSEGAEDGVTKIVLWGSPSAVRHVGGYAAIAGLPFRETLAKSLTPSDEVPATLKPWRTWLPQKDAAVVLLPPGIRLLSSTVRRGIEGIKATIARTGGQAKQAAAGLDIYVHVLQAAEKEVASVGLGVQRDAQGVIRVTKRTRLVHGGDWAAFAAEMKPSQYNALADLPDEPFVFAAGGPLSEASAHKLTDLSLGLLKNMRELYGLSEEQAKTLSELGKEKFQGIRGVSFLFGAAQGDEPVLSRMVVIMRVKNSETFLAEYEKYFAHYNPIVEKMNSPMFRPIQVEKTEIGGARALKVTTSVPQMPNMPPQSAKLMGSIYGPDGKIVAWLVPGDEHSVVIGYVKQDLLLRTIAAIKQGKPGLGDNREVAKVRAMLGGCSTFSMYFSPKGILDFARRMTAIVLPPGANVKIPDFGSTPPVAMAVTTAADEVEARLVVPAEVIGAIGRLIESRTHRNVPPASKEVEER